MIIADRHGLTWKNGRAVLHWCLGSGLALEGEPERSCAAAGRFTSDHEMHLGELALGNCDIDTRRGNHRALVDRTAFMVAVWPFRHAILRLIATSAGRRKR